MQDEVDRPFRHHDGGGIGIASHEHWKHGCVGNPEGLDAIAFNMLIDRGLVDINAPVAQYWPEFAQNGKQCLPVRYLLNHR